MFKLVKTIAFALLTACLSFMAHGAGKTYTLYLDADMTNNRTSGESIALGIKTALYEANYMLGDHKVELIIKDHRGSSARSKFHLEQIVQDSNSLAVFGGMHSPPLIKSRDFINENQLLTLVPWAAATPITRANDDNNWIFRLSVDDSKAGEVIINHAVTQDNYRRPHLILENTGWGKANERTMTQALQNKGLDPQGISFFKWGVGINEARSILEKAVSKGADSFILVANAPEGITFANAMLSLTKDRQRPIRSHWGITGGSFFNELGAESVMALDLNFIQTRFSFMQARLNEIATNALAAAGKVSGNENIAGSDIKAPTGFIHAYDLTRLFLSAANSVSLSGSAEEDMPLIKRALENLQQPVQGLIKSYQKPFQEYKTSLPDAHEALSIEDYVMAQYDPNGDIKLLNSKTNAVE